MKRTAPAETAAQVIYSGREFRGAVSRKGGKFVALDPDGGKIGSFEKRNDAFAAVIAQPRKPELTK